MNERQILQLNEGIIIQLPSNSYFILYNKSGFYVSEFKIQMCKKFICLNY
jgi:hypothetical protein